MNTTITDAAREAAIAETDADFLAVSKPVPDTGHYVQLAIDAATKEKHAVIAGLNEKLQQASLTGIAKCAEVESLQSTIAELRRDLGDAKRWNTASLESWTTERDQLRADLATTKQRLEQCEKVGAELYHALPDNDLSLAKALQAYTEYKATPPSPTGPSTSTSSP